MPVPPACCGDVGADNCDPFSPPLYRPNAAQLSGRNGVRSLRARLPGSRRLRKAKSPGAERKRDCSGFGSRLVLESSGGTRAASPRRCSGSSRNAKSGTSIVIGRGAKCRCQSAIAVFENESVPVMNLRRARGRGEDAAGVIGGSGRHPVFAVATTFEPGIRRDFDGQGNRRRGPQFDTRVHSRTGESDPRRRLHRRDPDVPSTEDATARRRLASANAAEALPHCRARKSRYRGL